MTVLNVLFINNNYCTVFHALPLCARSVVMVTQSNKKGLVVIIPFKSMYCSFRRTSTITEMPRGTKRKRTEDCASFVDGRPRYVTRLFLRERRNSGIDSIGPYFASLPPEMVTLLLSYLDAPALSSLGATCRVLNSYTNGMWKPLCIRLGLVYKPTVLCVANPLHNESAFSYDKAVELCRGEKCWEIMAKRMWLYSKWSCVVCYRNCSHRVDVHFDVALCDSCHPLFYRRKCHAKVRKFMFPF